MSKFGFYSSIFVIVSLTSSFAFRISIGFSYSMAFNIISCLVNITFKSPLISVTSTLHLALHNYPQRLLVTVKVREIQVFLELGLGRKPVLLKSFLKLDHVSRIGEWLINLARNP